MDPVRSLLFVPGHRDRMLEKAPGSGADGLLYDLEDSVPAAERPTARSMLADALSGDRALPRYIRVNGIVDAGKDETAADLDAVIRPAVDGIVLPKAQSADDIAWTAAEIDRLEAERGIEAGATEIVPMIESALGVHFCYEILTASPRVSSVIVGSAQDGDLQTDLGAGWSPDGTEILYARSKILLSARAAGIDQPLDGVFLGLDDEEGLIRDCENARRLGYRGKTVIHPRQIEPVHRVFTPTDAELDYYREMIAAFEEAESGGAGAFNFKGKMIDRAMIRKARGLLERFTDAA
jgi:citrate lyase subunit beta/citryl-CoA lyase